MIPVAGPSITDREVGYVTDAARNAWFADHGAYNSRFEEMFAETIGVKHAVSLPHCTSAIHLALAAKGIGPGDEVIVPDVTWIASAAPVDYVGAIPVFVDVDRETWCLDPGKVEPALSDRTKAIIGVDLYGSVCDWHALRAIADRNDLFLIEDAAEAIGSTYYGRQAGSLGDVGVFSFHGSKSITTGEGGMLVTNESMLYERVQRLRDHGRRPGDRYFLNEEVAFKYKMSALQAAMGLAQIERFEELIAMKRQIFSWYRSVLSDLPGLQLNAEPEGTTNSYWMVTIVPDDSFLLDKFQIMEKLRELGVDSRPFFSRLSTLPPYRDRLTCLRGLNEKTVGDHLSLRGVNLPSGYHVGEREVEIVRAALESIFRD